eukprot:1157329-Pelagomonas_calceolata.AAC.1
MLSTASRLPSLQPPVDTAKTEPACRPAMITFSNLPSAVQQAPLSRHTQQVVTNRAVLTSTSPLSHGTCGMLN